MYCPKTFKTAITLERHTTKFHAGESEEIVKRLNLIRTVVSTCSQEIKDDLCLDEKTRSEIYGYSIENLPESFFEEVGRMFQNLKRSGDAGEFYSDYFASITQNSVFYFPALLHPSCATLAMEIWDKLLTEIQSVHKTTSEKSLEEDLSAMELGGLQYLAGYADKIHLAARVN